MADLSHADANVGAQSQTELRVRDMGHVGEVWSHGYSRPERDRAVAYRTGAHLVKIVRRAQPIRPYGPPSYLVWTLGAPCPAEDCSELTIELRAGAVEVVEAGHWGSYNVIVRRPVLGEDRYSLAEVAEDT